MPATNPRPAVADMTEERLTRLLTERDTLLARADEIDAKARVLCRKWSRENGYGVHLSPEQVLREFEARRVRAEQTGREMP